MNTWKEKTAGKFTIRVVHNKGKYFGIVIKGNDKLKQIEGDDPEELWMQLHTEVLKSGPNFIGYAGAINRFLNFFPDGMSSGLFTGRERKYKEDAAIKLCEQAPLDKALTGSGFSEAIISAFRATNLLSPFEKPRVEAALKSPQADAFIQGAAKFAMGDLKAGLTQMEKALAPHTVAKWTAITYLPFLWRPKDHIFLKPVVTKNFADRVGHSFSELYHPKLNTETYVSLLDMARTTQSETAELNPTDFIDIQSFIWVVGEYDENEDAGLD